VHTHWRRRARRFRITSLLVDHQAVTFRRLTGASSLGHGA